MNRLAKLLNTLGLTLGLAGALIASASAAETIKVGIIAPLTGGGAPWGMATSEGPKIAAAEINAKGGLEVGGKKYQIQIIAYDDQYKAADSIGAYQRLVNRDGVKFVIIMSSAATLALQQNVEDDKVLALSSSYSSKAIDPKSKYMFRIFSPGPDYLPSFISWMKANVKGKRIAIVNPNDESGWDQNTLTEGLYKKNGFEVVGMELFERTQKDFQPMLTKVIGLKPDLIDVSSTPPATSGLIIRQARELGFKGQFVKTGGAGPKDIVAAAGKEAAEGTINMLYADRANAGYQRVVAAYKKSVGQDPNEIIVAFYDAANVLFRAIQKAGDVRDTAKVAAAFAQALPMQSVQGDTLKLGKTPAGQDREIITVNYIGTIKDGEPVIIGKTE